MKNYEDNNSHFTSKQTRGHSYFILFTKNMKIIKIITIIFLMLSLRNEHSFSQCSLTKVVLNINKFF